MKKLIILLVGLYTFNAYALSENARMLILMNHMNNQIAKRQQQQPDGEANTQKGSSKTGLIEGKIVHAQAENDGQSVAIFETKECGKLGYIPEQYSQAVALTKATSVKLKVEECLIKDVRVLP